MNSDNFWVSADGTVTAQRDLRPGLLELSLAFPTKGRAELGFLRKRLQNLQFSERSRLARAGIEVRLTGKLEVKRRRITATAEAFVIDEGFPSNRCFRKLLRPGTPVGRLFFPSASAKLNSTEIWEAITANRIKLPNTISIDRFGKVYFTPHKRIYTLPDTLSETDLMDLVSGERPRSFLDKVQVGRDVENLSIRPGGGILTSCSMYLPNHYVIIRRGDDHFGIHTGAVLLDPGKTFGTNIMLEIYNASEQMVVNPVISLEIFRAPPLPAGEQEELCRKRAAMHRRASGIFKSMAAKPEAETRKVRPRADIALRGQGAYAANTCLVTNLSANIPTGHANGKAGFHTVAEALSNSPPNGDTLVMRYFPNLSEQIEILSRCRKLNLKRLIFQRASRANRFFLPNAGHAQLDAYEEMGLKVYWHNEDLNDLYLHTYKKNRGFFIREELVRRFQSSTILAFYGSGVALLPEDRLRIETLIEKLSGFFGSSIGILTGGGDGAMGVATSAARANNCLTGACFLELEAQLPNVNVDFFNSFQETSRHNRQKWFEVADFCIFNVGGVGTMEEVGIELCNLKLGIRPRVPLVFFSDGFWKNLREQIDLMVKTDRAPGWVSDHLLFSNNPDEIMAFYRKKLQIL